MRFSSRLPASWWPEQALVPSLKASTDASYFVAANARRFLEELKEFVRFPSVSADPARGGSVHACADWVARHLRTIGLPYVELVRTPRHPIVVARATTGSPRPTLLVYGHYDVQPAEPLTEWRTAPFSPTLIGKELFGRGACDDKGQLFVHVKAVEALLRMRGALPVDLLCVFEGEEEVGSAGLRHLVVRQPELFQCDVALISDMAMPAKGQPALTYGLRGALSMELEVAGAREDLHSGTFGGIAPDAAALTSRLLASMHDDGRIAIEGIYNSVVTPSTAERAYMRAMGPADSAIAKGAGARSLTGEPGFSAYERLTVRPSLTVNGVAAGYSGPGSKAVIPARATAKLSMRLVPRQRPDQIASLVRRHVRAQTPRGATVEIRTHFGANPVVVDRYSPALERAAAALHFAFGRPPLYLRSGGTIPVVNLFQDVLRTTPVLMGFALPDSHIHAPNERLYVPNFFAGIKASMRFMELL
jgi:acetylornithine deacetylase/succinyl-diaminopimelate desuccinylase-like protein